MPFRSGRTSRLCRRRMPLHHRCCEGARRERVSETFPVDPISCVFRKEAGHEEIL